MSKESKYINYGAVTILYYIIPKGVLFSINKPLNITFSRELS